MTGMTRREFAAMAAAAAAGAGLGPHLASAQENYPTRPIQLICPWGAGGGTDATARIVAALLEKDFGKPVSVVNRIGGSGVVGHSAIATAAPDGYTLGIITVEIAMMHWQGLTELTPRSYTPLALMNQDPPGIQVKSDSPYKTGKDLADAAGGDGHQLRHRRVARLRRPEGAAAADCQQAHGGAEEGLRLEGVQRLHVVARLRRDLGRRRSLCGLHGRERQENGRSDEGCG